MIVKVVPIKRLACLFILLLLNGVACLAWASDVSPKIDKTLPSFDREMAVGNAQWVEYIVHDMMDHNRLVSLPANGQSVDQDDREDTGTVLGPLFMDEPEAYSSEESLPFMLQADGKRPVVESPASKSNSLTPFPLIKVEKRPKIAILIDDLGYNSRGMNAALKLPPQVALAILPMTPFAHQTAVRSKDQGRLTMLHAPMENERELKLGPGGLYAKMNEKELKAALTKDIDSLPGIQGVNNHMGSLLTANQRSMDWVMQTLKKRQLFFIDSLTSPHSVAGETAKQYGLKTTTRDVFLDNIRTEKAIDRQFTRLLKKARLHGQALAIGHPYPETMSYLKKRLNNLQHDGVILVPLSTILKPALPLP